MSDPKNDREQEDAARRNMLVMIGAGLLIVIVGGWLVFAIRAISITNAAAPKATAIATGHPSKSRARPA